MINIRLDYLALQLNDAITKQHSPAKSTVSISWFWVNFIL